MVRVLLWWVGGWGVAFQARRGLEDPKVVNCWCCFFFFECGVNSNGANLEKWWVPDGNFCKTFKKFGWFWRPYTKNLNKIKGSSLGQFSLNFSMVVIIFSETHWK